MELRDYMSIRRAYNIVRQNVPTQKRLTFSEFAILCRLSLSGGSLRTSDIADYQGSLRPTTTHRTKHLASLGLIMREKGEVDRRNVVCKITDGGEKILGELCALTCDAITPGYALSRIQPERLYLYVDSMGTLPCLSGELVLLGLSMGESGTGSVSELVELLGLLQPTVSMSVSSLVEEGLVERPNEQVENIRVAPLRLTELGKAAADEITAQITQLVVRRKSRSKS